MGICKLYYRIACYLKTKPKALNKEKLEVLASKYRPYAYIGDRRSLQSFVKKEAEELGMEPTEWFNTRDWVKNSGAFPDFVLAWESHKPLGNGALLELKDAKGEGIASFNSELPSARKRLSELPEMVRKAVSRYEEKRNCRGVEERDCFYLVRTSSESFKNCRLSIVQGTFFETLPNPELIASMFRDLFKQAGVPENVAKEAMQYLFRMDRSEIAKSRHIEKASVKPRLRIMSEIEKEGNPHTYEEIPGGTFNLIVQSPQQGDFQRAKAQEWIIEQFKQDEVESSMDERSIRLNGECDIICDTKIINHKRNGKHIVVQYHILKK